ncbi:MAG: hypothetical protein F4150_07520 [Chloroflexi bacterium]|nr:hypothetical protein [Chloroflexota bacterium]
MVQTLRSYDYEIADRTVDIDGGSSRTILTVPAFGDIRYWTLGLTEDAPDSGGTKRAGARISQAIDQITLTSARGVQLWQMNGAQLERIANQLDMAGENIDAPEPGDGAAVDWFRILEFPVNALHLVGAAGTDARLEIEWATVSKLYSSAPTAGKTTMRLRVRAAYLPSDGKMASRFIRITRVNADSASSPGFDIGRELPELEHIFWTFLMKADDVAAAKQLTDARLTGVTFEQDRRVVLAGAAPKELFIPQDKMARRDGHRDGEFRLRIPQYRKAPDSRLQVEVSTALSFDLVNITDGGAYRDKSKK